MRLSNQSPRSQAIIAGALVLGLGAGGYAVRSFKSQSGDLTFERSSASGVIMVEIRGQVQNPGLYELPAGARMNDLIKKAGGLSREADNNRINLADPLVDGCKVNIPSLGDMSDEPIVMAPSMASQKSSFYGKNSGSVRSSGKKSGSVAKSGRKELPALGSISINQASLEDLQKLPGVGPSTAQKIIALRSQLGGFKSLDQLMDVSGIGPKTYQKMQPYLRL
ncbi:MAG: helix-hairpin-helix domain-containing protein [Armatimonadetes bacterium]|nr:helix-hairpin-helix domain-containing protein [Armatimonadota bacterium]